MWGKGRQLGLAQTEIPVGMKILFLHVSAGEGLHFKEIRGGTFHSQQAGSLGGCCEAEGTGSTGTRLPEGDFTGRRDGRRRRRRRLARCPSSVRALSAGGSGGRVAAVRDVGQAELGVPPVGSGPPLPTGKVPLSWKGRRAEGDCMPVQGCPSDHPATLKPACLARAVLATGLQPESWSSGRRWPGNRPTAQVLVVWLAFAWQRAYSPSPGCPAGVGLATGLQPEAWLSWQRAYTLRPTCPAGVAPEGFPGPNPFRHSLPRDRCAPPPTNRNQVSRLRPCLLLSGAPAGSSSAHFTAGAGDSLARSLPCLDWSAFLRRPLIGPTRLFSRRDLGFLPVLRRRRQRELGGREERRASRMRRAAKLRVENRRARGVAKKAAGTRCGKGEPATGEPATTQQNPKQKTVKVPPARLTRWKTLPQATRDFIANVIERARLSSLPRRDSDQEASLQLLRQLEKRLLDRCSSLLVPPGKLKDLKNCRKLLVLEEGQLKEGEAALQNLQEELDRTLDRLEKTRDEAEVLQEEIGQLKGFLEEAEDQGMQDVASGVLNLPPLPPESFQQQTLQDQLMSIENVREIFAELYTLQRSSHVQILSGFLERAHAAAELLSHPSC
ncbi:uncharacterized protein LOC134339914 [Mobula hypostoma]|uniref:uncharacterized protein LOC134339914 n=1 Tax=Mobula hypostoma TaxID=723540 RepID=UPI002FC31F57